MDWITYKEILRLKEDIRRNRRTPKGILILVPYRLAKTMEGFPIIGSIFWFVSLLIQHLFGVILCRKTDIDGGLNIAHGTGLVIHARAIGKNCALRQNTTIGEGRGGIPTIGENVYVGANSVIIGKINIGDNVIIGAGAVVTKDVPSDCVALGNPAKVKPIREETARPVIF